MLESLIELGKVFKKEPAVVKDNLEKLLFIGDIHGDLDTVNIVKSGLDKYEKVIFLGDYVHRGPQEIEVAKEITNLKLKNKEKIILLPGNHETDTVIGSLERSLINSGIPNPIKTYTAYLDAFENAPIAYYNSKYKLLAIHGFIPLGIGQNFKKWKKIVDEKNLGINSASYQILWNDPYLSSNTTYKNFRGEGIKDVGKIDTLNFMNKNNIDIIIRAHEPYPEIVGIKRIDGKFVVTLGSCKPVYDIRKFYVLPEGKIVDNP